MVPTQPRLGEIRDVQLKDDSTVDLEDQVAKRVAERCTKEAQGNTEGEADTSKYHSEVKWPAAPSR